MKTRKHLSLAGHKKAARNVGRISNGELNGKTATSTQEALARKPKSRRGASWNRSRAGHVDQIAEPFITCIRKDRKTSKTTLWFNTEHPLYMALNELAERQGKTFEQLFNESINRQILIEHQQLTGKPFPNNNSGALPKHTAEDLQRLVTRSREIEIAADLEPGSVMDGIIEGAQNLWFESGAELVGWVLGGWVCANPGTVKHALSDLWRRWKREEKAA